MPHFHVIIGFACMACALFAPAQARAQLTAAQILDSSLAFCGGEQLNSLSTCELSYAYYEQDQLPVSVVDVRKPGSAYTQSILARGSSPKTTFFDGTRITIASQKGVRHFASANEVVAMQLKLYHLPQQGYKALKWKLERLADEQFKHVDCYVLRVTASNGYSTLNFFDKSNYKLMMVAYPNGNRSIMIDHRRVDGVLVNSRVMTQTAEGQKHFLVLTEARLNGNISPAWFACPYRDVVELPTWIKTGVFKARRGSGYPVVRTTNAQIEGDGKTEISMDLKWLSNDHYGLISDKTLVNNTTGPQNEMLVRIVSWDENGYVCQYLAGPSTGTMEYSLVRKSAP